MALLLTQREEERRTKRAFAFAGRDLEEELLWYRPGRKHLNVSTTFH